MTVLDPIINKQRELAANRRAEDRKEAELEARRLELFASTGIPAMWDALKTRMVPHWRGGEEARLVPLWFHARAADGSQLALIDWDGAIKARWWVSVTDRGVLLLNAKLSSGTKFGLPAEMKTNRAQDLHEHFVTYMANFLPPLEPDEPKA